MRDINDIHFARRGVVGDLSDFAEIDQSPLTRSQDFASASDQGGGANIALEFQSFPSAFSLSSLNGINGFVATGANASDWTGGAVGGGGDVATVSMMWSSAPFSLIQTA